MIDCADCAKFAYNLKPGKTQGKRILTGDKPIAVSRPPCEDDPEPDDENDIEYVCPKKKPGHSDLSEAAAEIFWHWRLCDALDDHPDDIYAKRYRRILDTLKSNIEQSREDEKTQRSIEAVYRRRR